MSNMNNRDLPMWLKRCLVYDNISKGFEIPFGISETILRYLASQEKKNSHVLITELKGNIVKYNRREHIKYRHDESVWFDDVFYDDSIGRGGLWGMPGHGVTPREFCESFLPCGRGTKIYEVLRDNQLGISIWNSRGSIFNLNISRFLTLSRCFIDCANQQMIQACVGPRRGIDRNDMKMEICEFYEYVDPPFRASYARMNLKNKRDQFYKHTDHINKIVLEECPDILEEESEYYMYLIKASLLKGLPLREIRLS